MFFKETIPESENSILEKELSININNINNNTPYKIHESLDTVIDSSRNGSGKKIGLDASYLGAVKQIPVLLKGIYEVMPNVDIFVRTNYNLDEVIDVNPLINELRSSDFYLDKNQLRKVRILDGCSRDGDLDVDFSVEPPGPTIDKVSYSANIKWPFDTLDIWIDPLKFEPRKLLDAKEKDAMKNKYGIDKNDYVIIGGSIHRHELKSFIEGVKSVKHSKPFESSRVVSVIVPRDALLDAPKMQSIAKKLNFYDGKKWHDDVVFVEEKGVLADLYSIADVAFIGDTLFLGGNGQNPLEPALYGTRIVSGKYRRNNVTAFDGLYNSGLLTVVNSADRLKEELGRIVPQEQLDIYRKKASEFIRSEQGAARKYAKVMQSILYTGITK